MDSPFFHKTYEDTRRVIAKMALRECQNEGHSLDWIKTHSDEIIQVGFEYYMFAYNSESRDKDASPERQWAYCLEAAKIAARHIAQANRREEVEPQFERRNLETQIRYNKFYSDSTRLDQPGVSDFVGGEPDYRLGLVELTRDMLKDLTSEQRKLLRLKLKGSTYTEIAKAQGGKTYSYAYNLFHGTTQRVGIFEHLMVNMGGDCRGRSLKNQNHPNSKKK